MSYRLHDLDDAPEAVRRAARERLAHAAAALREDGDAEAVHTARKDLKKTRSLLRLARPGLPRKHYRARNDELREIAAGLAGARDAEALAGAVEDLHEHAAGRLPEHAFTELAAALRASGGEDAGTGSLEPHDAAERLEAAAGAVADWPADELDADALLDGVALAYERGRDALRTTREDASSVALHEWRKRVKDLWYQARLLKPAAPAPLQALVDDAGELADVLGDEHDLSVLAERFEAGDPVVTGVVLDEAELRALVDERRDALRAQAAGIAARLYAERPKAFRRRLQAYLSPRVRSLALPERAAG
jgi:CHAD domain-containing protein